MSANLPKIAVPMMLDLSGLNRDLAEAGKSVDKWLQTSAKQLAKITTGAGPQAGPSTSPGSGDGASKTADPGDLAGDLAGALLPVAAKMEAAFARSLVPLNGMGARISAQMDAVGGTITTLARRIDAEIKRVSGFKTLGIAIGEARTVAAKGFAAIGKDSTKLATVVDRSLQMGGALISFRAWWQKVGDVAKNGLGKLSDFKPPKINFDQSTTSITNITHQANKAAGAMKGMGLQIGIALGAFGATYKAVDFLKDGVKSAVNFGETLSKVDTVFGPASAGVKKQADDMAKAFGLPKGAILDASASIGLLGKGAGLSEDQAAGMSNQMSKLAADCASFYNVPLDEALGKIRSGLAGEAEPLRAFGVLMTEDAIKAQALSMGLVKGNEELTEQAKVAARAAFFAKGLTDATGDLERTQGSTSNQARKFAGTLENLGTSIGTMLLPALSRGLALLNEFGSYIATTFEANRATLESWSTSFGTAIDTVGKYLGDLSGAFELARLSVAQQMTNMGAYINAFAGNVGIIAAHIAENWTTLLADGFNASLALVKNFAKNFAALGEAIADWMMNPLGEFKVDWSPMLDGFKATTKQLPELLKPQLVSMENEMAAVANRVQGNQDHTAPAKPKGPDQAAKRGVVAGPGGEGAEAPTKKLREFATKLREDTKTPLDKFREGLGKLDQALKEGMITPIEYKKGIGVVAKDAGLSNEVKRAGATTVDSSEGYSAILSAMSGGPEDGWTKVEKVQQLTLAEQRKQTAIQAQSARALENAFKDKSKPEKV